MVSGPGCGIGARPGGFEEGGVERPVRRPLPKRCEARTWSFEVGDAKGYLTASLYPDGSVGEIAVRMAKQGSTLAGMMDAMGTAVSVGLQHGAPLETFLGQLFNLRFVPHGRTNDPQIPQVSSVMDYVARRLALGFLDYEAREGLGVFTPAEREARSAFGLRFEGEFADLAGQSMSVPVSA